MLVFLPTNLGQNPRHHPYLSYSCPIKWHGDLGREEKKEERGGEGKREERREKGKEEEEGRGVRRGGDRSEVLEGRTMDIILQTVWKPGQPIALLLFSPF